MHTYTLFEKRFAIVGIIFNTEGMLVAICPLHTVAEKYLLTGQKETILPLCRPPENPETLKFRQKREKHESMNSEQELVKRSDVLCGVDR